MKRALVVFVLIASCKDAPTGTPQPAVDASVKPTVSALALEPEEDPVRGPKAFLRWAEQARAKPHTYGPTEECYGPESPHRGICVRSYFPDSYTIWSIDYVKGNPKAFRVHANFTETRPTCGSVGAVTMRSWRYASLLKSRCEFTSGSLSGLELVLQNPGPGSAFSPGTNVFLYSPEFLRSTASWERIVVTEGL